MDADSTMITNLDEVCASCGVKGGNGNNLKKCNGCELAWYCSAACQKEHTSQHNQACKRRAAQLREELLFKQPERSNLGDCPICFLPLPLEPSKSSHHSCCSKVVCIGCDYANELREVENSLEHRCPLCRTPSAETEAVAETRIMNRVRANDPIAICEMGKRQYDKQNYSSSLELWEKAVELGDVESHFHLAKLYNMGQGVEKDKKKAEYHLEEAAIGGDPSSRWSLGIDDCNNGRVETAVKHFIIAATLGYDDAIKNLMEMFQSGLVKKEDLAAALRAHHAAVNAAKSPQRDAAESYYNLVYAFLEATGVRDFLREQGDCEMHQV